MADSVINIIIQTIKKGMGDKDTKSALKEIGKGFQSVTGLSLSYAGAITATVAIGKKLVDYLKTAEAAANDSAVAEAKRNAILESTNYAVGLSEEQLNKYSEALSKSTGIQDDVIVSGEAVMLTFTNIGKYVFPTAMNAAINLSKVLDKDLTSSVTLVSKLLNVQAGDVGAVSTAMSAAKKVGVSFGSDQVDLAKKLIESGDVLGYQKLILQELQKEYGDAAEKMAEASDGYDQLKAAQDRYNAEVGRDLLKSSSDWNRFWTNYYNNETKAIQTSRTLKSVYEELGISQQGVSRNGQVVLAYFRDGKELSQEQVDELIHLRDGWDAYGQQLEAAAAAYMSAHPEIGKFNVQLLDEADALAAVKAGLAGTLKDAQDQYLETIQNLTGSTEENTTKQREAEEQLKKTTAQLIYQQVAAKLDAGSALDLARNMGLISEQDYAVSKSTLEVIDKFDKNQDGLIDTTESTWEFKAALDAIYKGQLAILGLPSEKVFKYKTYYETYGNPGTNWSTGNTPTAPTTSTGTNVDAGHAGEAHQNGTNGYYDNSGKWHWWAAGGFTYAGQSGFTGEKGIEYFSSASDGYIIPHDDLVQIGKMFGGQGGGRGGDVIIQNHFEINGANDARSVAVEVKNILVSQMKLQVR
jgi:hypothetical protein